MSEYKVAAGVVGADAARDATLSSLLSSVDAAVKELCGQKFEAGSYTEYYDAPPEPDLILRQKPVTAVSSVYFDPNGMYGQMAGGFATSTLLTAGTDYALVPDQPDGTTSRSGLLRRVGPGWWWGPGCMGWGAGAFRPVNSLASRTTSLAGAVRVTYTAGWSVIPSDLQQAVASATTLLFQRRTMGAPVTSNSWNGGSFSLAGPFLNAALYSPDVFSVLRRYGAGKPILGGGTA